MIELDRLRALLEVHAIEDFFGAKGRRGAGSSLTTGALFQAGVTLGLGVFLYIGLSPFALATAGLTLVATLTVLLLGIEAPLVLRLRDDRIAGFPVNSETVKAGRALHAGVYLVLGTTGAAIPIAVLVGFALGSVKAGLLTYAVALQQSLFFAALGAGLDSFLSRTTWTARLRPLVSFVLTGALVVALFTGIRPMPELESLVQGAGSALSVFPPAWFAAEILALDGSAVALPSGLDELPAIGVLATLAAALLALLTNAGRPSVKIPIRSASARVIPALSRLLRVTPPERATFDLTLAALGRDPDLALRAGPIFAFPAALLLVGAAVKDTDERRLFVHVLVFVSSAYLPTAVFLLARSREARARWIFDTAPNRDPEALRSGIWKASIFAMGFPLFVLLTAADGTIRGLSTMILHAPLVALVVLGVLDRAVCQLADPFPMGQDLERLGGDTGDGVIGLAFGLTVLGFVEAWAVRGPWTSLGLTLVGLLSLLAVRRSRRRRSAIRVESPG